MFSYESGWFRQWRQEGEIRIRFSPKPICETWRPHLKNWGDCEPETLWIDEIRRNQKPKAAGKALFQPLLFPEELKNTCDIPPRSSIRPAASRLWEDAPAHWIDVLSEVKVYPWRSLLYLSVLGDSAEDLFHSNPALAWMLASKYVRGDSEERACGIRQLQKAIGQRQRDQLALLDLPQQQWMVKLIRKLDCREIPSRYQFGLRYMSQNRSLSQIFQHADAIPLALLRLIRMETVPFLSRELAVDILEHFHKYHGRFMGRIFATKRHKILHPYNPTPKRKFMEFS